MTEKTRLIKVSIAVVKRQIKKFGRWEGLMVANNVNSSHVLDGWALGCRIEVSDETQLSDAIQNYKFYNYDRELWRNYNRNPHFYYTVKETIK